MTDKPDVFEEVKLPLTERSSRAVALGTQLTGLSRTDFINQAVQVRAYIAHVLGTGGEIAVRQVRGEPWQALHFSVGDDEIGRMLGE